MNDLKHEIRNNILYITMPNGSEIMVELFIRDGENGPHVTGSTSLQIQPHSSNRLAIECRGRF